MAGGEHGEGGWCSDRGAPPLPSAAWRGSLAGTPSRPLSSFLLPLSPFLGFDSMEPLLAPTELNSPKAGVTLSVQGGSLERRLVPVFRIRGHCHHRQMSPTVPRWTRQPVRRPRPRAAGGGGSLRSENGFALLATRQADSFTAALLVHAQRRWRRGDGRPAVQLRLLWMQPRRDTSRPSPMPQS